MLRTEDVIFKDWQWGECLEYLNNIIYHNNNAILVNGSLGSGKTTLKQEIIRCLPANSRFFSMNIEPNCSVDNLMRQVTIGFSLNWSHNNLQINMDELKQAILSQPECNWILFIDDAEKLSWDLLDCLIELYNSLSYEVNNFNLILFGDVLLANNIQNSPITNAFITKFQIVTLEELTLEQMNKFVIENMQLYFDKKTLKRIYTASNGIIGKVKQLAISELNIQNIDKNNILNSILNKLKSPMITRTIICCGLLLVAYGVFYFTDKQYINNNKVSIKPVEDLNKISIAKNINDNIPEKSFSEEKNLASPVILNNESDPNIKSDDLKNIDPEIRYEQLYKKLYAELKDTLDAQLNKQINELKNNIIVTNEIQNKLPDINTQNNNLLIKKTKFSNMQKTEQKILRSSKKLYVLQLMASKNENSIKKLIKNYPTLSNKSRYFSGKLKPTAELWYVAIYGMYSDPSLAIKDIKNLPIGLQKLNPIVRDYDSIHKLIKNKN